ncbi:thermonuclease family protein [Pleurocapsales cyanobacterium LEGE 06147]|nr:thermonuclease family protein [Pleurocapsales cyanobacterium LEGE 06147]
MNLKTFVNSAVLFIGLGLAAYSHFNNSRERSQSTIEEQQQELEVWKIKPGSIYDGDTLRVQRGTEELKIRFCGIDAPELDQPLGIESRDYLRSLIARGDGRVNLVRVEEDRYGRTIAELFVPIKPDFQQELHLNTEMVMAGYAWHYTKYSGNCPSKEELGWAEKIAQEDKLGVWEGEHQEPWEWRKNHK